GIDLQIVPYRGSPEAIVALLRKDVDLLVEFYAAVRPALLDGKLRALAVSGPHRSPALPTVPTVQEAGVAGYEVTSWNGMFAPRGQRGDIIDLLNRTLREILALPEVRKQYADVGIDARASSPEELATRLRQDIDKWAKVIERAGIPRQ